MRATSVSSALFEAVWILQQERLRPASCMPVVPARLERLVRLGNLDLDCSRRRWDGWPCDNTAEFAAAVTSPPRWQEAEPDAPSVVARTPRAQFCPRGAPDPFCPLPPPTPHLQLRCRGSQRRARPVRTTLQGVSKPCPAHTPPPDVPKIRGDSEQGAKGSCSNAHGPPARSPRVRPTPAFSRRRLFPSSSSLHHLHLTRHLCA